jgi:hypothetical protein
MEGEYTGFDTLNDDEKYMITEYLKLRNKILQRIGWKLSFKNLMELSIEDRHRITARNLGFLVYLKRYDIKDLVKMSQWSKKQLLNKFGNIAIEEFNFRSYI